jgi:hypothetical protein
MHGSTLPSRGLTGQLPLDSTIWQALPALTTLDLHNNTMNGYLPPQVRKSKIIKWFLVAKG